MIAVYAIAAGVTTLTLLTLGALVLQGLGRGWTADDGWFLVTRSLLWGAIWPVTLVGAMWRAL